MPEDWEDTIDVCIRPSAYGPMQYFVSHTNDHPNEFRIQVVVYPMNRDNPLKTPADLMPHADLRSLSVEIYMLPPQGSGNAQWTCDDVLCQVVLSRKPQTGLVEPVPFKRQGTFSFSDSLTKACFYDIVVAADFGSWGVLYGEFTHPDALLHLQCRATHQPRSNQLGGRREHLEFGIQTPQPFLRTPIGYEVWRSEAAKSATVGGPNRRLAFLRVGFRQGQHTSIVIAVHLKPGEKEPDAEPNIDFVKCDLTVWVEGNDWVFREQTILCTSHHGHALCFTTGPSSAWLTHWIGGAPKVMFKADIEFPAPANAAEEHVLHGLDFTEELTTVTIRLSQGPPLLVDKRLLLTRSEYFRDMLAEARWREACSNEIDLSADQRADHRSITAILRYMMSDGFHSSGNLALTLTVHALADQYRLSGLVDKVEAELAMLLSEDTVLPILGHLHGRGTWVESLCWRMLRRNNFKTLRWQEEKLSQLVHENPELAKQLILAQAENSSEHSDSD